MLSKNELCATELSAISVLDDYLLDVLNNNFSNKSLFDKLANLMTRFLISKYLILSMKEDIITKPKNSTYSNKLLFSNIDDLASVIATKQSDGTYNMNGRLFEDANAVIAYVRNKFAHADYTISKDYRRIQFAPDGDKIEINIMCIEALADKLYEASSQYRSTDEYTRGLVLLDKPNIADLYKKISDEELADLLRNIKIAKFDIKAKEETITKTDYESFDSIINAADKTKKVDEVLNTLDNQINSLNTDPNFKSEITLSIESFTEEEQVYLKDVFRKIHGNSYTVYEAIQEISNIAIRFKIDRYNQFFTKKEAYDLLDIIRNVYVCRSCDIRVIASVLGRNIKIDHDAIALIQILQLMNLSTLFENNDKVDYDLLDLLNPNPNLFIVKDSRLTELAIQIASLEKRIPDKELSIDGLKQQLEHIKELTNMPEEVKQKKIETLTNNIANAESILASLKNDLLVHKVEEDEIKKEKETNANYYLNKELLNCIRNSICHGNITVIPAGTLNETKLIFKDYDGDEQVLEYELTVGEIRTLMQYNKERIKMATVIGGMLQK